MLIERLSRAAIRDSAWWDTHPRGRPVRSAGDSRHVRWSDALQGYIFSLSNGGNKLHVSSAVEGVLRAYKKYSEDDEHEKATFYEMAKRSIVGSVVNHSNDFYARYPTRHGNGRRIEFGNHSIDIYDFCHSVIGGLNLDL